MSSITPLKRILVANRGEIASRVFRTAHQLGIQTVAIYADEDVNAPFVRQADAAVALKGSSAEDTYLNTEKILQACVHTQADAVHPGYGFLSENASFAQAVINHGLTWIGPPVEAIAQMGDKLMAKSLMQSIGIATLEAIEITPDSDPMEVSKSIKYPILVKASAGGGGRGMRIVQAPEELIDAIESAKREARAAFANDTVFLERWIDPVRHIEVQVLGDQHGNVVHLFERECSIQRRHQKIIEEAPSPAVDDKLRTDLGSAAIAIARKLNYCSAGTVEFLVSDDQFWFLEINTRLQVEHPITEAIVGRDLVKDQIRIAEGYPLNVTQEELTITGHSIEARLYAEDPSNDFLPSPGKVRRWIPSSLARYDSGVESGTEVNVEFDAMIAKVITHDEHRLAAINKLVRALEQTTIHGIVNNREFLLAILSSEQFLEGHTTTDFLRRVQPAVQLVYPETEIHTAAIGVTLFAWVQRMTNIAWQCPLLNPYMPPQSATYEILGEQIRVRYRIQNTGEFEFSINNRDYQVEFIGADLESIDLRVQQHHLNFQIYNQHDEWYVTWGARSLSLKHLPRFRYNETLQSDDGLHAPMPGRVLETHGRPGDQVSTGEILVVLEAMKMEHRIVAPRNSIIRSMLVSAGSQVAKDDPLVELEARC